METATASREGMTPKPFPKTPFDSALGTFALGIALTLLLFWLVRLLLRGGA